MARRSRSLKVSIVGAGSVGTALALLLKRKGYRIVSVISRHRASARKAARLVGCKRFSHRIADLHPGTNFLLIATSDESIGTVAEQISALPLHYPTVAAAHTSGFLTSDELRSLRRKGATVFSFHPIQTFPHRLSAPDQLRNLKGISYGVEGSPKAIAFARRLITRLGGTMLRVPKEQKISYHLACVFASNYPVALLGAAEELSAGFAQAPRLNHFHRLIESSINNAVRLSAGKALTGPIARGSLQTVSAHLKQLKAKHRHLESFYKTVGLYALELAVRGRKISPTMVKSLRKILQ